MNHLRRVNRTHAFSFVLLCICIVAFCVISASAATYSGKCGDNLTYTLNTNTGVLTISGTGAMADWSDSNGNVAPWYDYRSSIRTAQVSKAATSIGAYAFYGCSSLASITIPNRVTSIGVSAFEGCSSLTSISIPSGVTSIERFAFEGCSGLASITIPDSVTSIGNGAFSDTAWLKNLPNGVVYAGAVAYTYKGYMPSGTQISLKDGIIGIAASAFSGCDGLTSITIPDSVTSIGGSAFYGCSSLTSISIPSGVTSIGTAAFYGCSSLTSISIPSGVTSIKRYAFFKCSSLTSISIPSGVTSIERFAFNGCSGLNAVYITDIAAWCGIAFENSSVNPLSYAHNLYLNGELVTDLVIPSGVTSIGAYAFKGCRSLTSITIPDSVTSIEYQTFQGCSALKSIVILNPDCQIVDSQDAMPSAAAIYGYTNSTAAAYAVKYGRTFVSIGGSCGDKLAFRMDPDTGVLSITGTGAMDSWYLDDSPWYVYRASIRSIRIASGATSIGDFAFDGCSNLTEVVIAETVERIGDGAFDNCTSLAEVAVLNSACTMPTRADAFPASVTIHGFAGSTAEAYATKYNRTFVALDPTSLTAKVSAATYASGTATLRVTATPTVTEGMEVERYGVFFAPAKYADSYATNGQVVVKEGAIASGKPFVADLTDIPESAYDVKIYAWAFVKLVGVSDLVVCPLDPVSIHDIVK